ncbi:MarR family winged helix-turn-helix transcriptional regulator [Desulfarculus baarsii]
MERKPENILALAARLREKSNRFLVDQLARRGVQGFIPAHGDLMVALFRHGPLPMKDLAKLIDRDKSTLTALVDRLVERGLAQKQKDHADSRVTLVSATPSGLALKPLFIEVGQAFWQKLFNGFSEGEKIIAAELLGRMNDNMS